MTGSTTQSMIDPIALASDRQRAAADPTASVWVAASAGSGKTKVLTDRVLSLLLHGAAPSQLLCLTFTKAAAAEMSNRLAGRLASWAVMGDFDLEAELSQLLGTPPSDELLDRARRLFALVLDVPGGMKIQTIHAFCQSLLARFPLEAGISPNIRVLEEREAGELLLDARNRTLAISSSGTDAVLAEDLATITSHVQETAFSELMQALVGNRGRFDQLLRDSGGAEGLIARLYTTLEVAPGSDADALLLAGYSDTAIDREGLGLIAEALAAGSEHEKKKAGKLHRWLEAAPAERVDQTEDFEGLFLTKQGAFLKKPLTKKAAAAYPAALPIMEAQAASLQALRQRVDAARVARANAAFIRLGAKVLETYAALKRTGAALDYDDIILKARDLLSRRGAAAWVLFKLDGGLDHILIDEAQDTNPEQWQVVKALSEEFFAGEGGREDPRSVFAVGDAKQSIYSFQRADPAEFEAMRIHFERRVIAANQRWLPVELGVSFRSTAPVLAAVDAVFAAEDARDGVVFGEADLAHIPVRHGQAGLVELWPPEIARASEQGTPWDLPTSGAGEVPARARLAARLARVIHRWTLDPAGEGDPDCALASRGRRIQPGDVLVLVRRRNAFFEELVRDLKALDVPVAGVDRMVLSDQLAVMDLMALGQVMLLPEDDLTLACVLKGPFFGLSEEQLFELAHGREGSLWSALGRASQGDRVPSRVAAAWRELGDLMARADFTPPYEFYAEVLGRLGGRRKLLARLGPEAADAIEEFLNQALLYEREQLPSLQGFLRWLASGAHEVKRDMEHGNNAVRVMTVHGAKGLQAPIVILPDTRQMPNSHESLLWLDAAEGKLPLWTVKSAFDGPAAARAREAARRLREQEYRRLLYVAMTRAEDRLYLCGWDMMRAAPEGCWHNLVARGLASASGTETLTFPTADAEEAEEFAAEGYRLASADRSAGAPELTDPLPETVTPEPVKLPDWALAAVAEEPHPPKPLMPSRPSGPAPAMRSPLGPREGPKFRRGRMIHKLLQHLPDLAPAGRRDAARRLVAAELSPGETLDGDEIVAETLQVLAHDEFADLFGPGSRAEVPIIGLVEGLNGSRVVSGQVDRLVVTEDRVRIVDFKTNRPVPATSAEVPTAYVSQLSAYRAVLQEIYADKTIECLLLWTDEPRLMQVSDAAMAEVAP